MLTFTNKLLIQKYLTYKHFICQLPASYYVCRVIPIIHLTLTSVIKRFRSFGALKINYKRLSC